MWSPSEFNPGVWASVDWSARSLTLLPSCCPPGHLGAGKYLPCSGKDGRGCTGRWQGSSSSVSIAWNKQWQRARRAHVGWVQSGEPQVAMASRLHLRAPGSGPECQLLLPGGAELRGFCRVLGSGESLAFSLSSVCLLPSAPNSLLKRRERRWGRRST